MKSNAVMRILLYSAVLIVLIGILVCGLFFGMFSGRRSNFSFGWDDDAVVTSSGSTGADRIRQLEIDWASGSITIQPGETDSILYEETGAGQSKYQMAVSESGGKLSIRYCKNRMMPGIGLSGNTRKDLTITVPADWVCEELELNVASADVDISGLTIRQVDFNGASGVCSFRGCTVDELEADTASGDIRYTGTLNSLDCGAASASFRGVLDNCPDKIKMSSASGDLDLTLPADAGFTLDKSTASGEFFSEFPTLNQNGNHICGDGSCRITFSAASGNVTVRKGS